MTSYEFRTLQETLRTKNIWDNGCLSLCGSNLTNFWAFSWAVICIKNHANFCLIRITVQILVAPQLSTQFSIDAQRYEIMHTLISKTQNKCTDQGYIILHVNSYTPPPHLRRSTIPSVIQNPQVSN